MSNFLIVASQVAILFLLMGVGAALRHWKLLTDAAVEGMVNLLILIVTPCLIVDVFQRPFEPAMLKSLGLAFVIAVASHVCVIGLAHLVVRHRVEDIRRPLLLAAVFSNAGFIGIPLEQAVLGEAGVFYGIVYVAVFNLVIWSWGLGIMKNVKLKMENVKLKMENVKFERENVKFERENVKFERENVKLERENEGEARFRRAFQSPSSIYRFSFFIFHFLVNPGTIGLALGLPFFLLSVKLPAIVATPVHLVAGVNTPLAMIVIGHCLMGAKLGKVMRIPGVYVAVFIRLVACPLLLVAAVYPFRHLLDRNMMLALTIASAAPVAAMVSMFATKFERDVDVGVALVSGTTLLSILTMPPVIAFAMSVL